jgi:quercetin dioxygenase-like cupin family protein
MEKYRLSELDPKVELPGAQGRMVHSDHLTVSHWHFDAGADLPAHSHPHEQIANMISGEFQLTVDGEARILRPGDIVIVPPDVPHSGHAITASYIIDVFYPVREDFK